MKEQLISLAKLVEELGFKPKTATTIVIHRCFLGGKSVTINDTCIYLWMCEIQKWLREIHDIEVYVRSTRDFKEKKTLYCFHS